MTIEKKALDYSQCWANCLGDCDGGMSQEHLVSECLYGVDIKVKGLPWCKDDWRFLKIGTLTSPILCKRHNSALSEVDNGAKHTLNTISEAFALWHIRKPIRTRRRNVRHFTTDMLLFERWCLKTLININLNLKPGMPIQDGSNMPTEELVRVAFGLDRFKPPMGLYLMVSDKPEERTIDLIEGQITVLTQSYNDRLSGAKFNMWGFTFLLNLHPEPITWSDGTLMKGGGMKHWFQTRDHKNRLVKSHLLTYTYPEETT